MEKVWQFINDALYNFRECFSREATFNWFAVAVTGLMIRIDSLGVTSISRVTGLGDDKQYEYLLHFFHSEAYDLIKLKNTFIQGVKASGCIYRGFGRPILIGDNVKESKSGKKMPGVKKLYQESGNSKTKRYTWGHFYGRNGVVVGDENKQFLLPVSMAIHDGVRPILEWQDCEYAKDSIVTRMIKEAYQTAVQLKEQSYLILDRYFMTGPALKTLYEEASGVQIKLVDVITRAKLGYVVYEKQPGSENGVGQAKPGKSSHLRKLFETQKFTTKEIELYGKKKKVKYACVDMLWGQDLYQELRFVLVDIDGDYSVIVSTNLKLDPETIIKLYSIRFKIETCFRAFKSSFDGFGYRFWNGFTPTLDRYWSAKETEAELSKITDPQVRESIINTYKASETFVNLNCLAMGLLQLSALLFTDEINASPIRWLRTYTNTVPSEESTACALYESFCRMFQMWPQLGIFKIIDKKRKEIQKQKSYDIDNAA